jgi:hypothetical protein
VRSFLPAAAMTVASIAFQIALANGHFKKYDYAVPYLYVVSGVLWFVVIAQAVARWLKSRQVPAAPASTPSGSISVTVNPVINPIINQVANQSAQPASTHDSAAAAPAAEREPHAELVFVQQKAAFIVSDFAWIERDADVTPNALLAIFRNPPAPAGKIGATLERVTANLTSDPSGQQSHINFGTWIGEYTRYATFRPGQTHALVIVLQTPDIPLAGLGNLNKVDPRLQRIRSGITYRHSPIPSAIPPNAIRVEIALISENRTVCFHKFVLTSEPNKLPGLAELPGSQRQPERDPGAPNIVSLMPESRGVALSAINMFTDDGTNDALLAVFSNVPESNRPTSSTGLVTAQISYWPAGGEQRETKVHYGCWIRARFSRTTLDVGDTRKLLIAVRMDNEWMTYSSNIHDPNEYRHGLTRDVLRDTVYDVRVKLIDKAGRPYDFEFRLDLRENPGLYRGRGRNIRD